MPRSITLHRISKTYRRGARAVRDVSLRVEAGEFVVLLGPSGCGKSTILRMIAGLEELTEGQLLLDGKPVDHLPPAERGMAMIFQNYALYPHMSNRDNIGFPLKLRGLEDEEIALQVEATARLLAIGGLLDRYPGRISGGERQRVAMGRAIARRPTAFLMDEPLSNLDATLRSRLRADLAGLTRDLGVTTVYVTHDQAEAMSLADRVAVLRGGELQQFADPRSTYALPENVFVAAFIGTPRINLLDGVVGAPLDDRLAVGLGRQRLPLPYPLTPDHALLRVQQGRRIIVGLRSEAVRMASAGEARPGEVPAGGLVRHVEYQGHETLVHLDTGSRPAEIPELESPDPPRTTAGHVRVRQRQLSTRIKQFATSRAAALRGTTPPRSRPVTIPVPDNAPHPAPNTAGDLVIRAHHGFAGHIGALVPLLIDLNQLYVFDHRGRRICPAPEDQPDLET
jgi:multiple sugar transport system ATP-binding protein